VYTEFLITFGGNFGSKCKKNDECKTDSGLICVNNRCECTSKAYYSPGKSCGIFKYLFKLNLLKVLKYLAKKKTVNRTCSSNIECDDAKILFCVKSKCICDQYSEWSENKCGNSFLNFLKRII
jgi:hypothetical protein